MPTHDVLTISRGVRDLAHAIAHAEGFGLAGAIPTLANNPGDLVIPNWGGKRRGAAGISVFGTQQEGWLRLYHQLELITSGRSSVYTLGMSIREMADAWTATQVDAWALNVTQALAGFGYEDVTPDTLLGKILP